jgi:glycogen debranching enzyme
MMTSDIQPSSGNIASMRTMERSSKLCRHPGIALLLLVTTLATPSRLPAQDTITTIAPSSEIAWSTDSVAPQRFVSVHGHRAAIFGYSEDGLEFWAYPFQIVSSLKVRFHSEGTTTEIDGEKVLRRIIYSPEAVTRVYTGPDFVVKEKIFVPLDERGAIIRYGVASAKPLDIVIRFVPVLDLMWPGGIGGQATRWGSADSEYLLSEETHRFTARIGSPDIVSHDETPNAGRQLGREPGLSFTIRATGDPSTARVIIAGGSTLQDENLVATKLRQDDGSLEKLAADHYSTLLNRALQIETPDEATNRALAWSELALEQAWVCNPDLGCGLVAGYGPSRTARRPQYDWFFAGDGIVDLPALLASGQYEHAREELEFILRYQDKNTGMIWHELSQSAGWIDWSKYPYMFVHVELTFDFLRAVENYYFTTGDREFVKKHWPAIQSAYGYCRSLIDPKDGLPHIPAGKEGAREQERLTEELALSASWITASHAFAHLAAASDHKSAASEADAISRQAAKTIPTRYWDAKRNFWITGYTRSGAPLSDRQIGPVWILAHGLFSDTQRDFVLQQLASSEYQTDWGTRGRASSSSTYDPNSYANGSVWAVSTSAVAAAFWSAHRPAIAFPVWNALVPWTSLDSLGHMHETLAGDYYHEELESVPEQTWSSATFFASAVNGLLGLQVDAVSNRVTLAPHLPPSWNTVTVRNLHVGSSEINFKLALSVSEMRLEMENFGDPIKILFMPEIPLGAKLGGVELQDRLIRATLEPHEQDAHAKVEFDLAHGKSALAIQFTGGIAIQSELPPVMIGDSSRAIEITNVYLRGPVYTVDFNYQPSSVNTFAIRTTWRIKEVQGATCEATSRDWYQLRVAVPTEEKGESSYRRGEVRVSFQ